MASETLSASMARLEDIQDKQHMFNQNKIEEAEALAAEALRMANEAKIAAARLAEVKKTLAMFSSKLEKAEQTVARDVKAVPIVLAESPKEVVAVDAPVVEKTPKETVPEKVAAVVEETPKPVVEETPKPEVAVETPKEVVTEDVVAVDAPVVETSKEETPAVEEKAPVVETVEAPAPEQVDPPSAPKKEVEFKEAADSAVAAPVSAPIVLPPHEENMFENLLDAMGVGRMCGVDDETLGLMDTRVKKEEEKKEIFENPTRMTYDAQKKLDYEDFLYSESTKAAIADHERSLTGSRKKLYQRSHTNNDFPDPFGVDHDDLVMCGKLADACEPQYLDNGDVGY